MKTFSRLCLCLAVTSGLLAAALSAGTVINSNLPAGTVIVNIDAQADGTAAFSQPNPPQAYWYQPTASAPSVTLAAGTYQFRIINPTDAASLFSNLSNAQLSQIYTAWTFNSPWSENYLAFNATAILNPNETQLFDGALAPGNPGDLTFPTAQAAYDGTIANGYYNLIRPAPPGRAGTASDYLASFTFNVPTTLLFVIPDNVLGDNAGGVSVVITAVVPEPSAWALALTGSAGVLAVTLRRRRYRTNLHAAWARDETLA